MKILFFFTSFNQLNENKYQLNILNKLNNIDLDLSIDIILHNNNKNYNLNILKNSLDKDKLLKLKYINNIDYIHTNKNIGYLWGAQEALSDNFDKFKKYDYVIHLNINVFITNLLTLLRYLYNNLNNESIFFVNIFRNGIEGFRTNFTIFKPIYNIYLNYDNELVKKKLYPRPIPEKMLEYQIKKNNIKFTILPQDFNVYSDSKLNKLNKINYIEYKIFHIHCEDNLKYVFENTE